MAEKKKGILGIEPLFFKRRYGDKQSVLCNTVKRLRVGLAHLCKEHFEMEK